MDQDDLPGASDEDFTLTTLQVRAAQDGDAEAMEELFRRYLPRVARIVAARTGRSWRELGLDDDIVQETFLDAFAALRDGRVHEEGSFCNWLARCVQRNVQDQLRRGYTQKRGRGAVRRFADVHESRLTESVFEGGGPTPSEVAAAQETEARLEATLLEIAPRYREVISLRVYCQMSYRDIAAEMGLPSENTANVLFLRARKELRRRLES